MKIIFDFDYTLFDTRRFKLAFQKAFEKLGVDRQLFYQTYKESVKKHLYYHPGIQFDLIIKVKPKFSFKKLQKTLEEVLEATNKFLYLDTLSFLEKWQGKFELFLLSSGQDEFQRKKIENSGIKTFFEKIFTTQELTNKIASLKKVLDPEETGFFVDDRPEALLGAKKVFPKLITVRMKRTKGKYRKEPDNPQIDFSIKNLTGLERILTKAHH